MLLLHPYSIAEPRGQSLRSLLQQGAVDLQRKGSTSPRLWRAVLWSLLALLPLAAQAQNAALPDAPGAASLSLPQPQGSISGTITDADGDAIAGASITLSGEGLATPRTMLADRDGYFSFLRLPAGDLKLTISSNGFATVTRAIALQTDQGIATPNIILPVASADTDVEVSLTRHDEAELDMKTEESQRLVGFIPNFYVTYDWNAPPMSAGQKFRMSFRTVIDPANFAIAGIIAGIEQATNSFPGYHQGAAGFGKRYGATLADGTVGALLGGAVFPAILRQDPRYFYKGTGSNTSRFFYALGAAFVCRGDNGKWQPNYSSVLADVATGAISNTYYPASDRVGAASTIEIGLINAAEEGFSNLLEEFVFKHMSTGTPKSAKAKP